MTSDDVFKNFYGVESVIITDRDYAKPTTHWLFEVFRPWFETRLDGFGTRSWSTQWDCDDFAALYRTLAQVCHSLTHVRPEEGIAVGEVKYRKDSGVIHMINCAFTEQGLIWIEPQTTCQVQLSETELSSRSYVRF